jgi:phage gpG-like protein
VVTVSGLRTDRGILGFNFEPSIGILARDVDKLSLDIRSFKEPLTRAVREVVVPSIKQNFAAEGRPDGWEPLTPETLERKQSAGFGGKPILERTGALRRAATSMGIWTITTTSATVKDLPSNVFYGAVHQGGTTIHNRIDALVSMGATGLAQQQMSLVKGKPRFAPDEQIPARPFIMFQDEDIPKVEEVFSKWLDERILRNWSRHGL